MIHKNPCCTKTKSNLDSNRLNIVRELVSNDGFSLSVGSGKSRLADVNIDINSKVMPDIVADARRLPFKSSVFDTVYFTDVIEHLPKGQDLYALSEIARVLKKEGIIIVTCPNGRPLFTLLDALRIVENHTHYRWETLRNMLEHYGFEVETMFTAGGYWNLICNAWNLFVSYPVKRFLGFQSEAPFSSLAEKAYDNRKIDNGTSFFIKAVKCIET